MLFTFKISLRRVRENIYIENMNRTVTWWKYEQNSSVKMFTLKIWTGWFCEQFEEYLPSASPSSWRPGCWRVSHFDFDGVIWKFDELWCNSVAQSRRFAINKFGWLLETIFLNLKVGTMELMVFMFNPTHLWQVDVLLIFKTFDQEENPWSFS